LDDSETFVQQKKLLDVLLSSLSSGELFAQAPITEYPGIALETVSDSSRYFVLRIQDDNGECIILFYIPCHTGK